MSSRKLLFVMGKVNCVFVGVLDDEYYMEIDYKKGSITGQKQLCVISIK